MNEDEVQTTEKKAGAGQVMRLTVTEIAPGGVGVARTGKNRYFVRGGLPGDVVEARVLRRERGRAEAQVVRLLEGGMARTEPRCTHFGVCGGCLWQNLAYPDQLALKKGIVEYCFREAGLGGVAVADVLGSEAVFFYRNKMDFSFGRHASGELALGLFAQAEDGDNQASSKRMPPVFDLETCWLQSEASNQVVRRVRAFAREAGLRAYDPDSRYGLLRSLVVREGKNTGEVLVSLTASSERRVPGEAFAQAVTGACEGVRGVVLNVNRKRSRHAVPKSQTVLQGEGRISERVLGLEMELSSTSFFQVNTRQAEQLYGVALAFAEPTGMDLALDLYCGTGALSLLLAREAREVVGVEVLEQSVEDGLRNAGRNGISNCWFVRGDVQEVLPELARERGAVDLVAMNPPRAGVSRPAIRTVCTLRPRRVVYVSCNPETLAWDLIHFRQGGYRVEAVQPVDLFPHSPHCETVVKLVRSEE